MLKEHQRETGVWLGAVTGVLFTLGLFSISTASPHLLTAWFVGQPIQMSAAGAVVDQGLVVDSLRA